MLQLPMMQAGSDGHTTPRSVKASDGKDLAEALDAFRQAVLAPASPADTPTRQDALPPMHGAPSPSGQTAQAKSPAEASADQPILQQGNSDVPRTVVGAATSTTDVPKAQADFDPLGQTPVEASAQHNDAHPLSMPTRESSSLAPHPDYGQTSEQEDRVFEASNTAAPLTESGKAVMPTPVVQLNPMPQTDPPLNATVVHNKAPNATDTVEGVAANRPDVEPRAPAEVGSISAGRSNLRRTAGSETTTAWNDFDQSNLVTASVSTATSNPDRPLPYRTEVSPPDGLPGLQSAPADAAAGHAPPFAPTSATAVAWPSAETGASSSARTDSPQSAPAFFAPTKFVAADGSPKDVLSRHGPKHVTGDAGAGERVSRPIPDGPPAPMTRGASYSGMTPNLQPAIPVSKRHEPMGTPTTVDLPPLTNARHPWRTTITQNDLAPTRAPTQSIPQADQPLTPSAQPIDIATQSANSGFQNNGMPTEQPHQGVAARTNDGNAKATSAPAHQSERQSDVPPQNSVETKSTNVRTDPQMPVDPMIGRKASRHSSIQPVVPQTQNSAPGTHKTALPPDDAPAQKNLPPLPAQSVATARQMPTPTAAGDGPPIPATRQIYPGETVPTGTAPATVRQSSDLLRTLQAGPVQDRPPTATGQAPAPSLDVKMGQQNLGIQDAQRAAPEGPPTAAQAAPSPSNDSASPRDVSPPQARGISDRVTALERMLDTNDTPTAPKQRDGLVPQHVAAPTARNVAPDSSAAPPLPYGGTGSAPKPDTAAARPDMLTATTETLLSGAANQSVASAQPLPPIMTLDGTNLAQALRHQVQTLVDLQQAAGADVRRLQATEGDHQTQIELAPAELGRLKLILRSTDVGLSLIVTAERPETLDLVRRHIDGLQRSLQADGVVLDSVDIGTSGGNARAHGQQSHSDGDAPPTSEAATDSSPMPAPTSLDRATGRLDLSF